MFCFMRVECFEEQKLVSANEGDIGVCSRIMRLSENGPNTTQFSLGVCLACETPCD
jgi:hypothetical protein